MDKKEFKLTYTLSICNNCNYKDTQVCKKCTHNWRRLEIK